jgi:ParB-like chromosome segregation protein Spo0J
MGPSPNPRKLGLNLACRAPTATAMRLTPLTTSEQWPADQVERRPLAGLIPAARNARTHSDAQIDQIAASIKEWGWTMPLLVDEEGKIIAGHGRVLAAVRLGIEDVPVMVARGWSDAQKRAYLIADNKLALNAGWDETLLRLEIGDLGVAGFDITRMGFSVEELTKLSASGAPPEEFAEYGEDIPTEHQCPKCGFVWSGASGARRSEAA